MKVSQINDIIRLTTVTADKDDARAKELFENERYAAVDMVFFTCYVNKVAAENNKAELIDLLNQSPAEELERLKGGPSYIETGAYMEDQGRALCLYALGEVLGIWKVVTPDKVGIKDSSVIRNLARGGFVMITGYRPEGIPQEKTEDEQGDGDGGETH